LLLLLWLQLYLLVLLLLLLLWLRLHLLVLLLLLLLPLLLLWLLWIPLLLWLPRVLLDPWLLALQIQILVQIHNYLALVLATCYHHYSMLKQILQEYLLLYQDQFEVN
jgi:hypothetical protein